MSLGQVAGHIDTGRHDADRRIVASTALHGDRTARVEAASGRDVERAGWLALEAWAASPPSRQRRQAGRHARRQRARVRVAWATPRAPRFSPASTMRPRYITATRPAIRRTTPRSCETKRMPMPTIAPEVEQQVEDLGADATRRSTRPARRRRGSRGRAPGPGRSEARCSCPPERRVGVAIHEVGLEADLARGARPTWRRPSPLEQPWLRSGHGQRRADGAARVERGIGILEHVLDAAALGQASTVPRGA